MSAAVWVFILAVAAPCGSGVAAQLLSPTRVSLTSYNLNLALRWDPPEGASGSLRYTAEYRSSTGNYSSGCVNISACECDFTSLSLFGRPSIFEYGKYFGRVQAHLGSESSAWVQSQHLTLDRDTIIGPPTVRLFSNSATIEVSIEDPVFVLSSLTRVYSSVTYNISYWEEGQKEKAKCISKSHQNRVVLDNLRPWTKYCIQVQINTFDLKPKSSVHSRTVCESTTSEHGVPWVTAVVTFCVLAVVMALAVATVLYRRSISHFLCPKDVLPQHIKEYLLSPPSSTIYLEMQKPHLLEENYDPISIIADEKTVEVPGSTCSTRPDIRDR